MKEAIYFKRRINENARSINAERYSKQKGRADKLFIVGAK